MASSEVFWQGACRLQARTTCLQVCRCEAEVQHEQEGWRKGHRLLQSVLHHSLVGVQLGWQHGLVDLAVLSGEGLPRLAAHSRALSQAQGCQPMISPLNMALDFAAGTSLCLIWLHRVWRRAHAAVGLDQLRNVTALAGGCRTYDCCEQQPCRMLRLPSGLRVGQCSHGADCSRGLTRRGSSTAGTESLAGSSS